MLVPAAMIKLDKTNSSVRQPAGEETVRGKGAGLARLRPVKLKG